MVCGDTVELSELSIANSMHKMPIVKPHKHYELSIKTMQFRKKCMLGSFYLSSGLSF